MPSAVTSRRLAEGRAHPVGRIVKRFTRNAGGRWPADRGSTTPVTAVVHHAGITKVVRYTFTMS